jgi:hypothetical protein
LGAAHMYLFWSADFWVTGVAWHGTSPRLATARVSAAWPTISVPRPDIQYDDGRYLDNDSRYHMLRVAITIGLFIPIRLLDWGCGHALPLVGRSSDKF